MRERSWPPHRAQSFWGARCHQRRTAQVDFRRAERIQAGRTNDRTRWYDRHARAEVSFRKSRRLSGRGTRPEIFVCLPAFPGGGGRENRRLSSPQSHPQVVSALGDPFAASRGLLWHLISILSSSERQKTDRLEPIITAFRGGRSLRVKLGNSGNAFDQSLRRDAGTDLSHWRATIDRVTQDSK